MNIVVPFSCIFIPLSTLSHGCLEGFQLCLCPFLMCLSQVHTHGSFFNTLPRCIVPIQILLIRQSQVYMTILIIPKIHCRKLLQNVRVLLCYVFSNSTYLPVVYPLVFFFCWNPSQPKLEGLCHRAQYRRML